jgi:aldehyde:ferredoxin oxidoreductase
MSTSYAGRILHVDLTKGELKEEHPSKDFYRTYAGGSAMGMFYILRDMPKNADPLGAENILTLFTGTLTGLPVPGQSRICANARSPLTGAIGDSQAGGFFPAALKNAGYDGLVISGKASEPVYLHLNAAQAKLESAASLWGKETAEVEKILQEKHGKKIEVAQIGPAGENLVRYASIMNMHNRANGRTGMGAVMGSKMLKAIVVEGNLRVAAADKARLTEYTRSGAKDAKVNEDMIGLSDYGTAGILGGQNAAGGLPSFNFNEGTIENFMDLSGETMADTILIKQDTCYACSIRCKRTVETEYKNQKVDPDYGGPEYESISTLGTYCGITDLDAVSLANQMCNAYGMDTITCGATIAFAMECFENGLITTEDTDGVELHFGNTDAMLKMVEQIGKGEGFGALLAEGSARAAEKIGKDAEQYLITSKGSEAPAHMPQVKKSLGLIYAVNPFGADHQSSEHDPAYEGESDPFFLDRLAHLGLESPQPEGSLTDEKVRFAYVTQLFFSALESYSLCQFVFGPAWQLYGPAEMVEILNAATGWDIDVQEILDVGERRLNMMRAFNAREGFTRDDDTLPAKFYKPLQGKGPSAGVALDQAELEKAKEAYYNFAGWDAETGNPSQENLRALGLDWIEL